MVVHHRKGTLLVDRPHLPGDQFVRLHFNRCLAVSVCRGDVTEENKRLRISWANWVNSTRHWRSTHTLRQKTWVLPSPSKVIVSAGLSGMQRVCDGRGMGTDWTPVRTHRT
jgi:hypothetical protein